MRLREELLSHAVHFFFRARVSAAFLAEADLADADREAEALLPIFPPFLAGAVFILFPRPDPPGFFPPPVILFTVAHARRSASFSDMPLSLYPSSIFSA